ncbi:alpha/beta fold hydrolase [Lolliginicoccus levis]|uniref:alpha/beta fold hydrolase n=1 Tax=Lolliginicoccus levis TaxID=2919542 RepID=UPI00241FFF9B|nr:alpha/beta hydrolase [Lolliginicoccus levis]
MNKVTVGDIEVHVQRMGPTDTGVTVVLLHGLLYDSLASYYFTVGPALAELGVDVVMYDLRGHGRTTRPATGYQLEHFVDDLDGLLDALGITWPVHLVGNSFGGTIAFGFAAAHPERTASILFMEAEPPVQQWATHINEGLNDAVERLSAEGAFEHIATHHGSHPARLSKAAYKILETTSIVADIPASRLINEDLTDITCPVLGVFGTQTGLSYQVELLRGKLAAFEARILDGMGHSVLVEKPALTRTLVADWLFGGHQATLGEAHQIGA